MAEIITYKDEAAYRALAYEQTALLRQIVALLETPRALPAIYGAWSASKGWLTDKDGAVVVHAQRGVVAAQVAASGAKGVTVRESGADGLPVLEYG